MEDGTVEVGDSDDLFFVGQPANIFELYKSGLVVVLCMASRYFRMSQVVLYFGGWVVAKTQSDPWNVHLWQQDNRNMVKSVMLGEVCGDC